MTDLHPASLAKLVRSVAVLALPFEGQVAWLSSLGLGDPGYADELAQELGDGVLLSAQFVEAGWLRPEARQILVEMDALLAERGGLAHEDFWHLDGLRDSPDWAHIRNLALSALFAL